MERVAIEYAEAMTITGQRASDELTVDVHFGIESRGF